MILTMKNLFLIAFTMLLSLGLVACGGSDTEPSEAESTETETNEMEATQSETSDSDMVEITVNSGDDMRYDTDRIEVEEGQMIRLKLVHTGQMPVEAMGHNLVILEEDVDPDEFANAAMSEADTDYIPADMEDSIVAHTDLLGGGEEDTIEFEAPAAGTYTFLCSFPGHAGIMRGEFVVN